MALDSFSALKSAVAAWLGRSDLTAVIPDFITMAEAGFNRKLRTPDMESRSRATISGQFLALPDDFLGVRSVTVLTDPLRVLDYLSANRLDASNGVSGAPKAFTIVDDQFKFFPVPDTTYAIEIVYYARLTPLSDSATTNWLLDEHPDAYLYGALAAAEAYMQNDERLPVWKSLLKEAIDDLAAESSSRRYGAAPMRMRTMVTV